MRTSVLVFVSGFQEHQILLHWPARLAWLTEQWSAKCTVESWGCIFFQRRANCFRQCAIISRPARAMLELMPSYSRRYLTIGLDRPMIWFVFSWTLVDRLEILYYSLVLCLCVITDGDLRRNVGLEDWPSHQSSLSRGMWAWGKTKFWTASLVHQLHLELTSDPGWPRF